MLRFLEKVLLITLLFMLVFQTTKVNAQDVQNDSVKDNGDSYISLDLTTFIDSRSPRYRVGYIKDINERWKVGLEAGYGDKNISLYSRSDSNDRIGIDYRLWEVRPELIWIDNPEDDSKRFLSLEVFYINHKDVFLNGEYRQDNSIIRYSSFNYQRQKYGLNIKYGFIVDINDRLKLNFYSGLGFRIRNNSFTNTVFNLDDSLSGDDIDFLNTTNYRKKEGRHFSYNFPLGIKLFYKL